MSAAHVRLRHVSRLNPPVPQFLTADPDQDVTFVPLEAVWPGRRFDASRLRPKGEVDSGYTRFAEGDVLIPKITPTFEADRSTIASGLRGGFGCGTTELHVLRAGPDLDAGYANYVVSSRPFLLAGAASMIGVAGQRRVPESFIEDFELDLPGLAEQRAIADYLDAETARIDGITAARERQLHLLAARSRQAISSRLVHDGTDFVALRRVATVQGGLTINSARARDASSVDRPYLRVANVQDGHIDVTEIARVIVPRSLATQATLRPGDVLIAEGNGNPANLGRGAVWRGEIPGCLHQNHVHAIRPHSDVLDSDYLALLTRTTHARDYFASVSAQVGIATLSKQKVMDLRVPRRDIGKQRRIVQLIRSEQSLVQQVGELTRSQIRLLLEHRQALITAAVTGKIDVSTASGRGVPA